MTYLSIINNTKLFIQNYMNNLNDISHDYNHIKLVVSLAIFLAKKEGIYKQRDLFHIIMSALLHDYGDSKYSNDDQGLLIKNYLKRFKGLKEYDKKEIIRIASNISLSKEKKDNYNKKGKRNLKLYIIQDADRINSLGSIGIMRYISFNIINKKETSFDEIITTIEKRTLKIKRFLKTKTGIKIANKNLKLIENFIENYHLCNKIKEKFQ